MPFYYEIINCQNPINVNNVQRNYKLVKCVFLNKHQDSYTFYEKAWELAKKVNPHKANDSTNERDKKRLLLDALGGILAEYGWYYYIQKVFGNIVNFTEFKTASKQIDLVLNNGKTLEVRSSFPRNGVKFAICNERYNFKNICKYDNFYKPNEIDKDFFACVLFETPKEQLFDSQKIIFYLIGGSTRKMMENEKISYITDLIAEDDLAKEKTKYKVIKLFNALDIEEFENYMSDLGFHKINNL